MTNTPPHKRRKISEDIEVDAVNGHTSLREALLDEISHYRGRVLSAQVNRIPAKKLRALVARYHPDLPGVSTCSKISLCHMLVRHLEGHSFDLVNRQAEGHLISESNVDELLHFPLFDGQMELPVDVAREIISYVELTSVSFFSVGLVSLAWYTLVLVSWRRVVITQKSLFNISSLVLSRANHFVFRDKLLKREYCHLQEVVDWSGRVEVIEMGLNPKSLPSRRRKQNRDLCSSTLNFLVSLNSHLECLRKVVFPKGLCCISQWSFNVLPTLGLDWPEIRTIAPACRSVMFPPRVFLLSGLAHLEELALCCCRVESFADDIEQAFLENSVVSLRYLELVGDARRTPLPAESIKRLLSPCCEELRVCICVTMDVEEPWNLNLPNLTVLHLYDSPFASWMLLPSREFSLVKELRLFGVEKCCIHLMSFPFMFPVLLDFELESQTQVFREHLTPLIEILKTDDWSEHSIVFRQCGYALDQFVHISVTRMPHVVEIELKKGYKYHWSGNARTFLTHFMKSFDEIVGPHRDVVVRSNDERFVKQYKRSFLKKRESFEHGAFTRTLPNMRVEEWKEVRLYKPTVSVVL